MHTALLTTRKGAGMAEYAIVAALVAVFTIASTLLLGQLTKVPVCVAESDVAQGVLEETRAPCEVPVAAAPPPPPPPPGPVFETFVVDSELPGFFNPAGPAMGVEALAFGAPIVGQPTEQQIFNALCVALGHLGPASNVTTTTVDTANAYFLTGGRWVWNNLSETWSYDSALPPYGIMDGATPIVQSLSCQRIVP